MISLIRNKFESTVNQMRPLSPVIRIKGNQRRPLTVFDHTFDVRKGVFSCSAGCTFARTCEVLDMPRSCVIYWFIL